MTQLLKLSLAAALAAVPCAAQAAPSQIVLAGDVKLEKTVTEGGKSRIELHDPKVVLPGDRLVFSTVYTNGSASPAQNFVVTNPLPGAVSLIYEAAQGYAVSVDGGKTWGALAALKVSDGNGGQRPATAADATHLRWVIPAIPAGASGKVQYHAIVR